MELFPLKLVRLLSGPFAAALEADLQYVLDLDVDRLLAPFRAESRLPLKAQAYGNWESAGLDGHTAGHHFSALALLYAATGSDDAAERLNCMVEELSTVQAMIGTGYVGGVPGGAAPLRIASPRRCGSGSLAWPEEVPLRAPRNNFQFDPIAG